MLRCRPVLTVMVISGFMIHHMLRVNISIAIVEMIFNNRSNNTLQTNGSDGWHFNWDEEQKNDILGCFFWGYVITEIPGGRFSEMYGTRKVLGISMLLASLLTLLTPIASHLHYYLVLLVRIGLGLAMGVQWPSIPPMATKWVNPTDTSKFMSHMIASSLGVAITLPVCGYLILYFGWPSVFYVTGTTALIWTIAWFYLIYDSPAQHPRISSEERNELEKEIGDRVRVDQKEKTPWGKILTSPPVWAIVVANTCGSYSFFFVLSQLPSYMNQVLLFNIDENGLLSSLPCMMRYFMAVISCYIADKMRKKATFSTSFIRKLFSTLAFWGPAVLFTVQAFWGYNRIISVIVFTVSCAFMGCSTAGYFTNSLDISPIYSGTIYGLANDFAAASGYVSTKLVALMTKEEQTFKQWSYVFWVLVGVNLFGSVIYLVYGSGELQTWNPKPNETEMEKLKEDQTKVSNSLG